MPALWAVALIMLLSGGAKLRSRADVLDTFTRLRVPRPLAAPWLARAFPVLEVLLGLALLQPVAVLRPWVGAAAVVLFAAFLVLVVRAKDDGVSCGCFGEASAAPISALTVTRNVLFLVLAVLALAEGVVGIATRGPGLDWLPWGAFGRGPWPWGVAVALVLAAAALLVGRESVAPAEDARAAPVPPAPLPPSADGGDDDEPERRPFPDAAVGDRETFLGLHELVRDGAVLALRLSPGCGACGDVIARLPEFRDALGAVRLRVLVPHFDLGVPDPRRLGSIPEDLVLVDPAARACLATGLHSFPSAVLLGTDLLTAAGPVFGAPDVLDLLEEVRDIMAEAAAGAPAPDDDHLQETRP